MKLISMTDFVLSQSEGSTIDWEQLDWMNQEIYKLDRIRNYANFLKQPLELWMFVPCKLANGVWVVLEEPKCYGKKYTEDIAEEQLILHEEFVQAKEKVIFKNFKINYFDLGGSPIDKNSSFEILSNDDKFQICIYKSKPDYFIWNYKTIEDLVKYNLELTASAQKQIEL